MDEYNVLTEKFEKIYEIFAELVNGEDEMMNMAMGSSVICALIDEFAIQKGIEATGFAEFIAESVKSQHELRPDLYVVK